MTTEHPSFYQLDCLATGASILAGVETHVESCSQCSHYVARLQQEESVPRWVRQLDNDAQAENRIWRWRWAGGLASVVAVVCLLLFVRSNQNTDGFQAEYTTVKGSPSVGVYIKTKIDGQVTLWDGRTPVAPGDKLRLKVVPDGYHHVAVFSESMRQQKRHYELLYKGRVQPDRDQMIPDAWEIDESLGTEVIVIVMGQTPVTKSDIPKRQDDNTVQHFWRTRLVLQKSSR